MPSAPISVALGVLLTTVALAQPPAKPEFEVASIRPAVQRPPASDAGERSRGTGGGCPQRLKLNRGRVDIECATARMLIGYAYRFSPERVSGPDWMMGLGAPRFNIAATLPPASLENQVPEMVQALLSDRFKLTVHRATVGQAIHALVVAKGGLHVKEATAAASAQSVAADGDAPPDVAGFFGEVQTRTSPKSDFGGSTTTIANPRMGTVRETDGPNRSQSWEAPSMTLDGLAELLDVVAPLSLPVINMTGLKARYHVAFEVSLKDLSGESREATISGNRAMDIEQMVLTGFNDGLRKIGLQLERRKGPLETIVVDHVEMTPTGN